MASNSTDWSALNSATFASSLSFTGMSSNSRYAATLKENCGEGGGGVRVGAVRPVPPPCRRDGGAELLEDCAHSTGVC